MSITGPLAYFVLMACFIAFARAIAPPPDRSNTSLNVPLESLRGILATAVFFTHVVVTYFSFPTGHWSAPPSAFYVYLGSGAVTLFFFLSGFLFWSKCMADGGIKRVRPFYLARVRRIVPAYYASVCAVILIALCETGFVLRVSPLQLFGEVAGWLSFGLPGVAPPLNGWKQAHQVNASVVWTLQLEIAFYLFLPLIARLFKGARVFLFCAVLAVMYMYTAQNANPQSLAGTVGVFLTRFFAFGFGFGMMAAYLKTKYSPRLIRVFQRRRWTLIPLSCLAFPIALHLPAFSVWEFLALIVPFAFISAGNDLFGLLSYRPVLLLGKISYSFYVTHGITLFIGSHLVNAFLPVPNLSPTQFWLFALVCGICAILVAAISYEAIELRFIKPRAFSPSIRQKCVPLQHEPQGTAG